MKNKTSFPFLHVVLITVILILSLSFDVPRSVLAQTDDNVLVIPFSDVGMEDITLKGPYDSHSISFSLPDSWKLLSGSALEIHADVFITTSEDIVLDAEDNVGAVLYVYFNRKLQQIVPLRNGQDLVFQVPIRVQDLNLGDSDGRAQVSFFLDAGIDCEYDFHRTSVNISAESNLQLLHTERAVEPDLRELPRPFYKRSSYVYDATKVVIGDSPTADELRAAYLVMASFGRMSNRQMDIEIISVDDLAQTVREDNHLVFVGKATSLDVLYSLDIPVRMTGSRFQSNTLEADDGLIQMSVSPWNPTKMVMVVGGNTDAGVAKAGQALTTANLQTGIESNVSYIANVLPFGGLAIQADGDVIERLDYTLEDLGYGIEQSGSQSGIGTQWFSYNLDLPFNQYATGQPNLELIFSHSPLIDPNRSDISLYVNGTLAGGAKLAEGENNYVTANFDIPSSLFKPGKNRIDFAVELIPYDVCTTLNLNGLWMSVYPESSIHIPLTSDFQQRLRVMELRYYPYTLFEDAALNDVTVVVSRDDPESWLAAGELLYQLGGSAIGSVVSFDVAYSDSITAEDQTQNLLFVGVPTELGFSEELNGAMPAPFEAGSNVAVLEDQNVVYRVEPRKSLGFLELMPSPWQEGKTILMVLGTDPDGLFAAKSALLNPEILSGLAGDFATIDGEQYTVVNTRTSLGLGSFAAAVGADIVQEEIQTPEQLPLESLVDAERESTQTRESILVVLQWIFGAMFFVVIIALLTRKRNRATE